MFIRASRLTAAVIFAVGCLVCIAGCRKSQDQIPPSESPEQPATSPKPAASPLTGFEKDLQYIKNGQYTYIWVFSRRDGKSMEPDDSKFLRTNAPQVVDWVLTEDKKKVIGGTNFNLEEGNMKELRKRFVVEDYSSR